jgi:tetratricopeptide (TPR) repeat protein
MFDKMGSPMKVVALVTVVVLLSLPLLSTAQDLVPISSLTGGSSVFLFRNSARAAKRAIPAMKPNRTKAQRLESVTKIKKQFDTIAKVTPQREKAKVVDPLKLPKNARTLPAAEGSKLFAGVGEYYTNQNDIEKATEFFRDAVDLDPTNKAAKGGLSETLATKGNELLVAEQAASAKGYFLEALKFDPSNAAAYFGLGEVYSELDQTKEAIESYERSLATDKNLTEIYVPLGILYYQSGDIAKADYLLTKALASSGSSAETQFFLGLVRLSQNRNEEALMAFQRAQTIDGTQAETYFYIGQALERLKRTTDAVPQYKRATELKPAYFDAWFQLGESLYQTGKFEDAITVYKAALKLKNNDWEVFAGLADSYRQTDHFDDATGAYRNAAMFYTNQKDFNPNTAADLYSKIGLSIGQQCDINMQRSIVCQWPSAIKALQKAVDLTNNPIDQVNLGWAYFRVAHPSAEAHDLTTARPNLELARDILQKAAAAGPPASDFALQNLASVQIDLGDNKGAIDTLSKLVKSRPDLSFAQYALGVAYFKSGNAADAEKAVRAAVQAEPANVNYMMALGDILINRKNGKDARKIADQMRGVSPASAAQLDTKIKIAKL